MRDPNRVRGEYSEPEYDVNDPPINLYNVGEKPFRGDPEDYDPEPFDVDKEFKVLKDSDGEHDHTDIWLDSEKKNYDSFFSALSLKDKALFLQNQGVKLQNEMYLKPIRLKKRLRKPKGSKKSRFKRTEAYPEMEYPADLPEYKDKKL